MQRYTTEIVIPSDRAVTIHLPDWIPPGHAVITIRITDEREDDPPGSDEPSGIEWWEEFGETSESEEPRGLSTLLAALER